MKKAHVDEENLPLDFSITKTVVGLFGAAANWPAVVPFSCKIL